MKKFLSVLLCAALSLQGAVQTFAYTTYEEKTFEGSAHSCDHVVITTTDYYNVNGRAYIPVSTLKQVADSTPYWTLNLEFNSSNKTLSYENYTDGSSIHAFKCIYKADQLEYTSYNYAAVSQSTVTADLPPKIINDRFCLPAKNLYGAEYNPNTKELTFTVDIF